MNDRRSNDPFQNDIMNTLREISVLCERAACHHEAITEKVKKLEDGENRQWWVTHIVTPIVFVGTAVARHFGVKI